MKVKPRSWQPASDEENRIAQRLSLDSSGVMTERNKNKIHFTEENLRYRTSDGSETKKKKQDVLLLVVRK